MYQEPTRMRDIIAMVVFGKKFDDLTDEEKMVVHNKAVKLQEMM